MRLLPVSAVCLVLAGCAGVGIVATADPLTKLNDAAVLFTQKNRPVPAEKLINEAIDIYQREGDAHGLGNAYREYGDFLTSPAVVSWESQYRRDGFLDKSIDYDNRLAKAKEFYRSALENYERAAVARRKAEQYDALTNVYFNMALVRLKLGEATQACEDYDHTVQAYSENMRRNPAARPIHLAGFRDLPEAVADAKQRAACPH